MDTLSAQSRLAYYAAGVLLWARQHVSSSFERQQLRHWHDDSELDYDSESYLGDEDLLSEALRWLNDEGIIEHVTDPYGPPVILLVEEYALSRLSQEYPVSPFARLDRFGSTWLKRALLNVTKETSGSAASSSESSTWALHPLRTEDQALIETLAALENTLQNIRTSNELGEYTLERDSLLGHAQLTVHSATEGFVTEAEIQHNIIGAGRWLAEKFGNGALGALGSQLVVYGQRLLTFVD